MLAALTAVCAPVRTSAQDIDSRSLPAEARAILNRNAVGTVATDFSYVTPEGNVRRMKAFKSEYLLLYFFNSECYDCVATIPFLSGKPEIAPLLESGRLKILAIDTNPEFSSAWSIQFPKGWTLGCDADETILNEMLYIFRSSPAMYLLDRRKNVLIKDATIDQLRSFDYK